MLKTIASSKSSLFAAVHFLLIYKYFSFLFEIPFFTSSHRPFYRWYSSFDIFTLPPFIAKISSFVHLHRLLSITRIVFLHHLRATSFYCKNFSFIRVKFLRSPFCCNSNFLISSFYPLFPEILSFRKLIKICLHNLLR